MLLTIVMVMGLLPGTAWATTEELECTHTDAELSKDSSGHSKICLECGESWEPHSDADGDAAECSHAWGEWYTTVYPECEYVGVEQRDCSVCGAYEENDLSALGHNWVWDTLPTTSVNGIRHCATCGTVETDLRYDASYYWTFACNNKASEIDEDYSDYNNEFMYEEDDYVALQDPSLTLGGLSTTTPCSRRLPCSSPALQDLPQRWIPSKITISVLLSKRNIPPRFPSSGRTAGIVMTARTSILSTHLPSSAPKTDQHQGLPDTGICGTKLLTVNTPSI